MGVSLLSIFRMTKLGVFVVSMTLYLSLALPAMEQGVCNEPQGVVGNCRQRVTMWTYYKAYRKCLPYFGCREGNGNKFNSKAECENLCVAGSEKSGSQDYRITFHQLYIEP